MAKNTDTADFLKRWTLPPSYYGATWEGFWVAPCTQNRDSGTLERCNFTEQCKALREVPTPEDWNPANDEPCWQVVSENHWAVGWVEWVAIHPEATKHLKVACEIAGALDSYPVLNDMALSELEHEEAAEQWAAMSTRERVELMRRCHYRGTVLAARRDYPPHDDDGSIQERLLGH